MNIVKTTHKIIDLKNKIFDAVYLACGHGRMFDFPNNDNLAAIMLKTWEKGGV